MHAVKKLEKINKKSSTIKAGFYKKIMQDVTENFFSWRILHGSIVVNGPLFLDDYTNKILQKISHI